MLLIVPFRGALIFTEAFSVKHYDDNSQDEHYEGSGRVRRSRGRGEDFGRERSDRTERSRPARIRTEAGTVVLAGFHAVAARLKLDPESIQQVYVDPERRDKRMREMREKLFAAGVRVMNADAARLDGLSPDVPHQGIAAIAAERENTLDFADLLDQITDRTLLLILDGVTDPRNFGACLRAADAAGVQAVIVPRDRSARMTPAAAKAAAGAAETVPVVSVTNLASAIMELRDNGVFVAGTAGGTEKKTYDAGSMHRAKRIQRSMTWLRRVPSHGFWEQKARAFASLLAAAATSSLPSRWWVRSSHSMSPLPPASVFLSHCVSALLRASCSRVRPTSVSKTKRLGALKRNLA